jgi:hypothetical protein
MQDLNIHLDTIYDEAILPQNLPQCLGLKRLKISGSWYLIAESSLEVVLPRNLESLTLQSTGLSHRPSKDHGIDEPSYRVIENLLANVKTYCPRLKEVVVSGGLTWVFDEEALNSMQGGVVYLVSQQDWETESGLREKAAREEGKRVFALQKWDLQGNTL